MRDYYAEEIGNSVPSAPKRDYFTEEVIKNKPEPTENLLQRAIKSAGAAAQAGMQNVGNPLGVSVNPKFPFLPNMPTDSPALSAGMNEAQMPITKGDPWAQAGMGLASGVASGIMLGGGQAVKGASEKVNPFFKGLKARKSIKEGTSIQEGVRGKVLDKFLGRTKEFDEKLSKLPDAQHDVTDIVNRLKSRAEFDPSIREAIDNSPTAKKLMFGDETGRGKILDPNGRPAAEEVANQSEKILSTKEIQNLRNELGKAFDYSSPEHSWQLGRELSNLRLRQAEPFPKEMGEIAKGYKDVINNYGVVRPYLRESRLGGSLLKGFGGEGGAEVRKAMDYFTASEAKGINQIYKSGKTSKTITDNIPFKKLVFGK